MADALCLFEYPQHIAAKNLLDIASAVAAIEQGLRDLGQVSRGVDALWGCPGDAIEVRAQAKVVNPRDLGDVIDLINQGLQRRAGNLGRPFALDAVNLDVG